MRFLPTVLAGVAAVAVAASAAVAAGQALPRHHMTVQLPDGGSLQVEYSGNVPPRVSVVPTPSEVAWPAFADFGFGPSFAKLRQISADMDRRMNLLLHQAATGMPTVGANGGLQTIDAASMPAGSMSYSFVSTSNGRTTCSRMVEVTKPANGAKPKVVSHSSGNCKGLPDHESGAGNGNSI